MCELEIRQKVCRQEADTIKAKRIGWAKEIADYQSAQKHLLEQLKGLSEDFTNKDKVFQSLEKELQRLREQQTNMHREHLKNYQLGTQIDQEMKTQRVRLENHQEKKKLFEERKARLEILQSELELQGTEKKLQLEEGRKQGELVRAEMAALEEKIASVASSLNQLHVERDRQRRGLQDLEARQKALVSLKEDNAGFSLGSKKILKEAERPESPLYGQVKRLYECFEVATGYEQALSMALKPYSETLVVENESALLKVLAFAEASKIKDFSLICGEHLSPQTSSSEDGLLTKVKCTPLTAHFLSSIFLADELSAERACITPQGLFLDHLRVIHGPSSQESSVFMREGEIKELSKKIKSSQVLLNTCHAQIEKEEKLKQELGVARQQLDRALRSEEMKLVEVNFHYQRLQTEIAKTKKEIGEVDTEITMSSQTIAHLSSSS